MPFKTIHRIAGFCLGLTMSACVGSARPQSPLASQTLPVSSGQSVVIEMNTGTLAILTSGDNQLEITGQTSSPPKTSYQVTQTTSEIHISAQYNKPLFSASSSAPLALEVRLPAGTPLRVETFDAGVTISDYQGSVSITSVSGDIQAQNLSGVVTLRSGRGDIQLSGSSGELKLLGEHGVLSIAETHGEVGASTIMGTIRYSGAPGKGDAVHLETDHGPVAIQLEPGSDLAIGIMTTSGTLTCGVPGVEAVIRGCTGTLGHGAGTLTVRTVSGEVTLQPGP